MTEPYRDVVARDSAITRSRLLREWSRGLRESSLVARHRSDELVQECTRRRGVAQVLTAPEEPSEAIGRVPVEPAIGDVPVVDLFVILVENHHLEVRDAVARLTVGMLAAGYPADSEHVSATDAMDILEGILGTGSG